MLQHNVIQQVYRNKHKVCRLQEMQVFVSSTVLEAVGP